LINENFPGFKRSHPQPPLQLQHMTHVVVSGSQEAPSQSHVKSCGHAYFQNGISQSILQETQFRK
jgi:hypothetical protein